MAVQREVRAAGPHAAEAARDGPPRAHILAADGRAGHHGGLHECELWFKKFTYTTHSMRVYGVP